LPSSLCHLFGFHFLLPGGIFLRTPWNSFIPPLLPSVTRIILFPPNNS
jgi:hypothetical protein